MSIIDENEIHVWIVNLNDFSNPEALAACHGLLCESELLRANRYHFRSHRERFEITRGLIRHLLSRYNETTNPRLWTFSAGPRGKPYISWPKLEHPLYFNISHSGNRIVFAFANNPEIGVDIEQLSRTRKVQQIASRYFSGKEVLGLCDLAPDDKHSRFFDLWTLKEAYIKACGRGLVVPLRQFSFEFPSKSKIVVDFEPVLKEEVARWCFWQFDELDEYRLALAVKSKGSSSSYKISCHKLSSFIQVTPAKLSLLRQSQGGFG